MKPSVSILATLALLFSAVTYAASIDTAKSLYNKGDISSALKEVNKLLKDQNTHPDGLFLKAQLQYETGAKDKAINTYKSIIQHHPKQLEAYNNLAAIYAQHDNLQAASEVLEAAMRVDPVYATIYENLRAVYWDMSRRHVRAALKLKPLRDGAKLARINTPLPDTTVTNVSQPVKTAAKVIPEAQSETKPEQEVAIAQPQTEPKSKPEPKPEPKPQLSDEQQIEIVINNWAKAWSNRNAAKYVAAYTSTYRPTDKKRSEWVAGRRWNFKSKKFIKVTIDRLKLSKVAGTYIANFRQSYQSDLYKDKVLKELKIIKQNGAWQINQETTLKAL